MVSQKLTHCSKPIVAGETKSTHTKWCLDTQVCICKSCQGYNLIITSTGFIPKGQNYFGSRYTESSRYAISSFETDQQLHQLKINEMQTLSHQQGNDSDRLNFTTAQNTTPLVPTANKAAPFLPAYAKKHSVSPFALPYGHPNKYFMSGYMGFVPRSEKYFGQGYPINTKRALVEFAEDGMRMQEAQQRSFTLESPVREKAVPMDQHTLYPRSTGLIPHYTGHIPGG